MYVIIAKILTTNKKNVEAYKLYDTETKDVGIVSLKKVKEMIYAGTTVIGLKTTEQSNYSRGKMKISIVKERGKFGFNKIPEIDGSGQPVNEEDKNRLTVLGWKGFAEVKKYICIDYEANIKELSVTEFEEAVRNNNINGASINPRTDRPAILNTLNIELEWREKDMACKKYGFYDFNLKNNNQREKPPVIRDCPDSKIRVRELEEFGHTYKKPIEIRKINILNGD